MKKMYDVFKKASISLCEAGGPVGFYVYFIALVSEMIWLWGVKSTHSLIFTFLLFAYWINTCAFASISSKVRCSNKRAIVEITYIINIILICIFGNCFNVMFSMLTIIPIVLSAIWGLLRDIEMLIVIKAICMQSYFWSVIVLIFNFIIVLLPQALYLFALSTFKVPLLGFLIYLISIPVLVTVPYVLMEKSKSDIFGVSFDEA